MKTKIAVAIVGAVLGFTAAMGGADEIENLIAPVAGPTELVIDSDDGKELCWSIKFKKLREAYPSFFSWQIETLDKKQVYLGQYRPDRPTEGFSPNQTAQKGEETTFKNCASKPANVGPVYTLKAYSKYKVWHGLWEVPRYIGPYFIVNGKVVSPASP